MRITSNSSFVQWFEHDPDKSILTVKLAGKPAYRYKDVTESMASEFESADSHGKFYNANIKGQFEQL